MLLPTMFLISALLDPTPQPTAADLAHELDRLTETARVLYVAAHPDDENTQLLGYMANNRGWRAAYLSLTRGEGGQNAIGDEFVHGLGLIRTWELLTARSVDGAEQWISRQRDFGYSKSAAETLDVWGDEAALGDVVRVIRTLRPDVVVTRFPEEGSTHGHHLASAQLARRAFQIAGDADAYPEQLTGDDALSPWQPQRLLYNVPLRWMGGEILDEWYTVDLGDYDARLGLSYGELAARSRSMHRSQAFGSAARRGPDIEAFELLEGSEPQGEDPFADIASGWATRPGGQPLADALEDVVDAFDFRDPAASIDGMFVAHAAAGELTNPTERDEVRSAIEEWIVGAAGVFLDARVEDAALVPGTSVDVSIHALARAESGWRLDAVSLGGAALGGATAGTSADSVPLDRHVPHEASVTLTVPENAPVTTQYWLQSPSGVGAYAVPDEAMVGQVVGRPAMVATCTLSRGDGPAFDVEVPVRVVSVDPTLGERVEPARITPPLLLEPASEVVLLPNGAATSLEVTVEASQAVDDATVRLDAPTGWTVAPASHVVALGAGERTTLTFTVATSADAQPADLQLVASVGGREDSWTAQRIDYPHLPPLTMLLPATVRATPLEWNPVDGVIGYVMGPGDAVATSLQAAGMDVRLLDDATLESGDLGEYRAILVGPRAYHERAPLRTHSDRLWAYAEQGGVVVVQYQTNNRSQVLDVPVGPAPIEIGRGRVTVESAPVTWLDDGASVRDGWHALTDADFDGWVQERGLYFAQTWDAAWTPLVTLNDPGEEALEGALLVAHHGDGAVFYAGLSFFRQLPAGVPGAYRLLANLLAYDATLGAGE